MERLAKPSIFLLVGIVIGTLITIAATTGSEEMPAQRERSYVEIRDLGYAEGVCTSIFFPENATLYRVDFTGIQPEYLPNRTRVKLCVGVDEDGNEEITFLGHEMKPEFTLPSEPEKRIEDSG